MCLCYPSHLQYTPLTTPNTPHAVEDAITPATSRANSRSSSRGAADLEDLLGAPLDAAGGGGAPPRARTGSVASPESVEAAKNRLANMSLGGDAVKKDVRVANLETDIEDLTFMISENRDYMASVVTQLDQFHATLPTPTPAIVPVPYTILQSAYHGMKTFIASFTEDGYLAPKGEKVKVAAGGK